jgi:UDP-N-acetylglucosamine acyltransferase
LRRRGFSRERIAQIRGMHRLLYRDGLTLAQSREAIQALRGALPDGDQDVERVLAFLDASTRGIVR